MKTTVVGGTFTIIHRGHRELLKEACRNTDRVIIGLSTDSFAKSSKNYSVPHYEERKEKIQRFLSNENCDVEIRPLSRAEGTAAEDPGFHRLVVSEETLPVASAINESRRKKGLNLLEISFVPVVLGQDLFPVSSRRIIGGIIDPEGKRLMPLSISIASANKLKEDTVKEFFNSLTEINEVRSRSNYDTIEQPFGEDISRMAVKRAQSCKSESDYNVGIEAGLMLDRTTGSYMDVHHCAVIDRYGNITTGQSSGFKVPDYIIDQVKLGVDVSKAYENVHGVSQIGAGGGIAGIYSSGHVKRKDLILESIRNAFIPRRSPYRYGLRFPA